MTSADGLDPFLHTTELETLSLFLDSHRSTLLATVEGLTKAQLAQRVAPSSLTLAGLVKHLAYVEDWWFVNRFLGDRTTEPFASAPFDEDPDWEFHSATDDEPDALVALYTSACERSRGVVRRAGDLDATSAATGRDGEGRYSLRWIMLHMIEETARHNGHADLLREAIDGRTVD